MERPPPSPQNPNCGDQPNLTLLRRRRRRRKKGRRRVTKVFGEAHSSVRKNGSRESAGVGDAPGAVDCCCCVVKADRCCAVNRVLRCSSTPRDTQTPPSCQRYNLSVRDVAEVDERRPVPQAGNAGADSGAGDQVVNSIGSRMNPLSQLCRCCQRCCGRRCRYRSCYCWGGEAV